MRYVYLAGPVTGLTFAAATEWRQQMAAFFRTVTPDVRALDPLRGMIARDFDAHESLHSTDSAQCTIAHYMARDLQDIDRSQLVLANLLDMEEPSIGTMIELGYARAKNVPILVAAAEPLHPWVELLAVRVHRSPLEAAQAVVRMLSEART